MKTESRNCFCICIACSIKLRLSCPQIWNVEKEKDRAEKEKVGDWLAKLNRKKSDIELEREKKLQRRHFLLEEQHENFIAVGRK